MDAATAEAVRWEADGTPDVHLLLRFILAEEVPTLFAASDVAVMPYMARSALNSGVAHLALSLNTPAVLNDTPVAQDLRDLFGKEWVWLCDGTAEDAMQQALAAAAAARPPELDLRALDYGQLAAKTHRAYADAIAARLKGR
jgi:beta-1,4-mannosyltransferase